MSEPLSALPVEFLFRIDVDTSAPPPTLLAGAPHGSRMIVTATEGSFEGPRLSGRVVPGPGSEWATLREDGSLHADVRLLLETRDGAHILMTYNGIGREEEGGLRVRTAPLFQTGHADYAWLNQVQAVGLGAPGGRGIVYDVYQVL